ncbi:MAG: hypothetical protein AUG49_15930 [Catenulispora sp. 13_1_20CM_3_70_7]|nr:MAG: hypothetical protein AUG49_15930 [Catenulispora sp. 13_1_20CM_3_70_7]
MTEPVEFELGDTGTPRLSGQEGQEGAEQPYTDPYAEQATAAMVAPLGWTPAEGARVIGGLVATVTTILYAIRYQAAPAPDLVPAIAGDPEREFPLLGMSLVPILDLVAPKGSAAAVGVGLGAGVSELMGAMVRRMPVLTVPPPDRRTAPGARPAPATSPSAAAAEDSGGFAFKGDQLRTLARADGGALTGLGLE